jgi:hypothetical protein
LFKPLCAPLRAEICGVSGRTVKSAGGKIFFHLLSIILRAKISISVIEK